MQIQMMTQIIEHEKNLRELLGMGGLQSGDVEPGGCVDDTKGSGVHGECGIIRQVDGGGGDSVASDNAAQPE